MLRVSSLLLFVLAGLVDAQRPVLGAGGPAGGAASPPPATAGHRTARDRQLEAGRRRFADARRRIREDRERFGEERERLGPRGLAGAFGRGPIRGFPAGRRAPIQRAFIATLEGRIARIRDESRRLDITAFGGGASRRLRVECHALRLPDGQFRHLVTVMEGRGPDPAVRERLLIAETPGKVATAWRIEGGAAVPYRKNPLLFPLAGPGHPLLLIDVLPFHPRRQPMELIGRSERDGRPVLHFRADPMAGRPESKELVFRKISALLVGETAQVDGATSRESVASSLKRRAGRLTFERVNVRFRDTARSGANIRLIERKLNRKLDPGLFDPGRFR